MNRIMQFPGIGQNRAGFALSWTPGGVPLRRNLGQQKGWFEKPGVAIASDLAAIVGMGYLSLMLGKAHNNWQILTWSLTTAMGIKLLHDAGRSS